MSETKTDDTPAFPSYDADRVGLSKREWYAGMAMQGLIERYGSDGYASCANSAFSHADAMLAHEPTQESD